MNIGDLSKMGPDWLHACPECRWGIIQAPPVPMNMTPLYQHRRTQALLGQILFCVCEAGERYQRYLLGLPDPDPAAYGQGIGANAANEAHRNPEPWHAKDNVPASIKANGQPERKLEY